MEWCTERRSTFGTGIACASEHSRHGWTWRCGGKDIEISDEGCLSTFTYGEKCTPVRPLSLLVAVLPILPTVHACPIHRFPSHPNKHQNARHTGFVSRRTDRLAARSAHAHSSAP